MLLSNARRVTRAAGRPTGSIRVQLRAKSMVQRSPHAAPRLSATRQLPTLHARSLFTRKAESVPIVQAIVVDRFGQQRTVQCQATPRQTDTDHVLLMAKWAAALLASGACMAGAMSENGQAHAASSNNNNANDPNDADDLFEQLKKKVQALVDDNKAALQNMLPSQLNDAQKDVDEFLSSGKSGQISWGFLMGACSGFALKKASKLGALALGSVFILFQCASYAGYINVNHHKIERDVMDVLDLNKDGQFDSKDVDVVYKKVMKVLEHSLPVGSGFTVGFFVGFRSG